MSHPCPICSRTFPENSQFVQPQLDGQMNIYDLPLPAELVRPPRTSSVDARDVDDLASVLREIEHALRRGQGVQHLKLVFEAQDIVDRIRHAL